jgi:AGCS family alanine or glycine:cation symporter
MVAMPYGIAADLRERGGLRHRGVVWRGPERDPFIRLERHRGVFIVSFVTSSISALSIIAPGCGRPTGAAAVAGSQSSCPASAGRGRLPFGYTSLTGWPYYGEQFEYIFGARSSCPTGGSTAPS